MSTQHVRTLCPRQVAAATSGDRRPYLLREDYYAVHGRKPAAEASNAEFTLQRGEIAVFRAGPADNLDSVSSRHSGSIIGPVYATADGPLVVPTGKLFVRFAEGVSAAEHRSELNRAGFEIVEIPAYAQHAAWVRGRTGDIAESLHRIAELETVADVENVEPQMLLGTSRR